ncbi:MAG TPA: glycoside hydrolase family 9 protein [Bacilli bacterium]
MSKLEKMITESRFAHEEIKPNLDDCAETRWLAKQVLDSKVIHNCNSLERVQLNGIGSIELSDFSHSGSKSILLKTNTDIEDKRPRPASMINIQVDNENWEDYNRVSLWIYPEAVGFQNFYFHFSIINTNSRGQLHAPSLTPNTWNHVVWELTNIDRNNVVGLHFGPLLMGCPPEAKPELNVYIDDIKLQKVNPDYVEGWDLDNRIAYCHSGYFSNAKKIAVTQEAMSDKFYLYDEQNRQVFSGDVEKIKTDLGEYYQMDFSNFTKEGEYYLVIDNRKTPLFVIDNLPYASSIWKSLNFLRMLRCGYDVPEVHSPCHLSHHTIHPDGRLVPDHGGWHDAGDVSQFEICTAEMAHAILDLAESLKNKDKALYERLLEEARWGMNWLLRTRFNDGYRSLSVHYSIWRKYITKGSEAYEASNPIFTNNIAEFGTFENFLAAAAEAVAARMFKDIDSVFADWCKRSAIEDFDFAVYGYQNNIYTKRWGPGPDAQVCGAGALAAAELYTLTQDEKYLQQGSEYAKTILACQQQDLPDWDIPLRGFFYEDPAHTHLLTYEHRGHEQSPIHGLTRLIEVAPHHKDAKAWMNGIKLYAEYILKTADIVAPYNMLPAHVYDVSKLNMMRFTIPKDWATEEEAKESFKRQIENGIKLSDNVYLRRFPIAIQRRGFHATLLSKAKAVSAIANILHSSELRQVAINQLEWILGKNPFASSTMYGEGHNYHPLYVAFSRQLVGALPVGIKTYKDHDAPFWPVVNDAVYKEIWGHTTGKYLWVLADLLK